MEIGILINIIALILLIVYFKAIKCIKFYDVREYNGHGEPISVQGWTSWDKAWHTIRLPLWSYILLILVAIVPYIGTLYCIFVYWLYYSCRSNKYFYIKPIFLQKLDNALNKVIKPIVKFLNTEI